MDSDQEQVFRELTAAARGLSDHVIGLRKTVTEQQRVIEDLRDRVERLERLMAPKPVRY